ncbi:MAG: hypothetical protein Q8K22_00560 [Rhodoferax sp.]|nr:hypothetical protein [Rhodoferax sp.]
MKHFFLVLALATASLSSVAGTNVGVSVSVNQPGLYGRVDIGNVPMPPVLVYPQPVIIQQPAVVVQRAPIYLHVPPGHAKNWRKHCGEYAACGQPVYFVHEDWYQQQYVREREHDNDRGRGHGKGNGHGKGKGKGKNKHND